MSLPRRGRERAFWYLHYWGPAFFKLTATFPLRLKSTCDSCHMVRLARGRNGLIRDNGNDTQGRNPSDKVGDEESSWKIVKKRKTKGKKAVPAAGSEKDPQAATDTKAKRTFWEVVLGDDPVFGKKEQDLLGRMFSYS